MSILKTLKKTRLFDFQAGTPAKSSEIDQEFNQFIDTLSDIVDDLVGINTGHTEHITSTSAHSAENITFRESSGLASVNVEQVLKSHGHRIANHLSSTILIDGESKHWASHVFNDSSVAGDSISEALNALKSDVQALATGEAFSDLNITEIQGGTFDTANIIQDVIYGGDF